MEINKTVFDPLIETVQVYGQTSFELFKLRALDKTAELTSVVFSRVLAYSMLLISVIAASIGTSLWLGQLLGKLYYGFFCTAGIYMVVFFIIYYLLHNRIRRRAGDVIVSKMCN
jgi:hypothetical protein